MGALGHGAAEAPGGQPGAQTLESHLLGEVGQVRLSLRPEPQFSQLSSGDGRSYVESEDQWAERVTRAWAEVRKWWVRTPFITRCRWDLVVSRTFACPDALFAALLLPPRSFSFPFLLCGLDI